MNHKKKPLLHPLLHAGVHCKESLIRLEDPVVSYILNAGASVGLFQDTPLLSCVLEILHLQDTPTHTSPIVLQQITDGMDVEEGRHKTLVLGLSSYTVGQLVSTSLSLPPG